VGGDLRAVGFGLAVVGRSWWGGAGPRGWLSIFWGPVRAIFGPVQPTLISRVRARARGRGFLGGWPMQIGKTAVQPVGKTGAGLDVRSGGANPRRWGAWADCGWVFFAPGAVGFAFQGCPAGGDGGCVCGLPEASGGENNTPGTQMTGPTGGTNPADRGEWAGNGTCGGRGWPPFRVDGTELPRKTGKLTHGRGRGRGETQRFGVVVGGRAFTRGRDRPARFS